MWRNYLTVGFRAFAKNKTYTFVNIFGLTLGFAACVLILLFVRHHFSYDAWLPNAERTYQVQSERVATDEPPSFLQRTFYPVAAGLRRDFPEVEAVTALWQTRSIVQQNGQSTYAPMVMADESFFDVLNLPLVRGDRQTALGGADSLVLTETEARKYFGNEDPMGRTLTIARNGVTAVLRVTGVLRDLPDNSHIRLAMVSRISGSVFPDNPQAMERWNSVPAYVYVRLRPGADPAAINARLPAWEERVIPVDTVGPGQMSRAKRWALHLENVRDVHLGRFQEGAMTPGNDRSTLLAFAVVAILILGIACVNFVNLTTARATQRAREVALRKVLGAMRRQLIAQFLGEAVLMAFVALLLALALVELTLPALSAFLDDRLTLVYVGEGGVLPAMFGLALVVGLIGGLYPAFYLSGFSSAAVLKAGQVTGTRASSRLRTLLVVAQFSVSICLIICTAVIYLQTQYVRNADAGYDREGLIVVENLGRAQVVPVAQTIRDQVARLPGVVAVGRGDLTPADEGRSTTFVTVPGRTEPVGIGIYGVDENFFGAMGIEVVAGRAFSTRFGGDDATVAFSNEAPPNPAANVVLSVAGARQLGYRSPQEAIGKQFRSDAVTLTVVGVVADVQYRSMRDEMEPILYYMTGTGHGSLVVRYASRSAAAPTEQIRRIWQSNAPDVPFEAVFVANVVAELYDADEARGYVFAAAALLAIAIGCLGLYALAAFTAERRTKEIGLRKVLGARTRDILRLLMWQFSKPVIIANLIAWPIAWWVMTNWLAGFNERISLSPVLFVGAGLVALVIAAATIASHAVRIARANPIIALRYE
ncbi:MAG TPA: ABC transporter permease [Allosphingosinicella sp.]|nr:ABC transporter permease [Allosphingosinicella sp.]